MESTGGGEYSIINHNSQLILGTNPTGIRFDTGSGHSAIFPAKEKSGNLKI